METMKPKFKVGDYLAIRDTGEVCKVIALHEPGSIRELNKHAWAYTCTVKRGDVIFGENSLILKKEMYRFKKYDKVRVPGSKVGIVMSCYPPGNGYHPVEITYGVSVQNKELMFLDSHLTPWVGFISEEKLKHVPPQYFIVGDNVRLKDGKSEGHVVEVKEPGTLDEDWVYKVKMWSHGRVHHYKSEQLELMDSSVNKIVEKFNPTEYIHDSILNIRVPLEVKTIEIVRDKVLPTTIKVGGWDNKLVSVQVPRDDVKGMEYYLVELFKRLKKFSDENP